MGFRGDTQGTRQEDCPVPPAIAGLSCLDGAFGRDTRGTRQYRSRQTCGATRAPGMSVRGVFLSPSSRGVSVASMAA